MKFQLYTVHTHVYYIILCTLNKYLYGLYVYYMLLFLLYYNNITMSTSRCSHDYINHDNNLQYYISHNIPFCFIFTILFHGATCRVTYSISALYNIFTRVLVVWRNEKHICFTVSSHISSVNKFSTRRLYAIINFNDDLWSAFCLIVVLFWSFLWIFHNIEGNWKIDILMLQRFLLK